MSIEQIEVMIPSSKEERKKIMDALREVIVRFMRIESERNYIKETINNLSNEYQIPKKFLNKMARTYFKQNYDEMVKEQEEFQILYENIMNSK